MIGITVAYQEEEKVSVDLLEDEDLVEGRGLVVHNDEVNSFDYVTNILVKVCKHEQKQAEQCTYIIHYKGKCEVKKGTYEMLKPMKEAILDAGIQATIT